MQIMAPIATPLADKNDCHDKVYMRRVPVDAQARASEGSSPPSADDVRKDDAPEDSSERPDFYLKERAVGHARAQQQRRYDEMTEVLKHQNLNGGKLGSEEY